MYEVLKTEKFAIFFSFMIGLSIVAILIPVCKGDQCYTKKAPSVEEMKKNTYRIGSKCYQFKPETTECPASGVIEAFSGGYSMSGFKMRGGKAMWTSKDGFSIVILLVLSLAAAFYE